jgi:hypothetical protein
MKRQIMSVSVLIALGVGQSATAGAVPQEHAGHAADTGPPLTLRTALDEALTKNLDLAALKAQVQATRERPAQERSPAPPMLEGTIVGERFEAGSDSFLRFGRRRR